MEDFARCHLVHIKPIKTYHTYLDLRHHATEAIIPLKKEEEKEKENDGVY